MTTYAGTERRNDVIASMRVSVLGLSKSHGASNTGSLATGCHQAHHGDGEEVNVSVFYS